MTYEEYRGQREKLEKAIHYYSELYDAFCLSSIKEEIRIKCVEARKALNAFQDMTIPLLENKEIEITKEEATELIRLLQYAWPREAVKEAEAEVDRIMATRKVTFDFE